MLGSFAPPALWTHHAPSPQLFSLLYTTLPTQTLFNIMRPTIPLGAIGKWDNAHKRCDIWNRACQCHVLVQFVRIVD